MPRELHTRRDFLRGAANGAAGLLLTPGAASFGGTPPRRDSPPPHIALVAIAGLEWNAVFRRPRSAPRLARLLSQGVLFTNAYIQRPGAAHVWAGVLTGLRPDTLGAARPNVLRPGPFAVPNGAPTLHHVLRRNGYDIRTAGIVEPIQPIEPAASANAAGRPSPRAPQCLLARLSATRDLRKLDAQLDAMLGAIEARRPRRDLAVFLWPESGDAGHRPLCPERLETITRAPLLASAPGLAGAGTRCTALVEYIDTAPTAAELAGLGPWNRLDGTSFAPLLRSPARRWKPAVYSQAPCGAGREVYTTRTRGMRLVEWRSTVTGRLEHREELHFPRAAHEPAGRPEFPRFDATDL